MIGKASEIKTVFVDGNAIGDLEKQINGHLEVNKDWEVIDIRYNMLTDPACDHQLYMTAIIIYKEATQ